MVWRACRILFLIIWYAIDWIKRMYECKFDQSWFAKRLPKSNVVYDVVFLGDVFAVQTIETTKTMAASTSSCSHTIAAADSFEKLKKVMKKVADQTSKVYGESGEGLNGKKKESLRAVHNAIVEFVNEADYEHHMHQGEPTSTRIPGERVVCNKLSPLPPPSPPPSPPPLSPPPSPPLSDSNVKIAHSTSTWPAAIHVPMYKLYTCNMHSSIFYTVLFFDVIATRPVTLNIRNLHTFCCNLHRTRVRACEDMGVKYSDFIASIILIKLYIFILHKTWRVIIL